LIESIMQKQEDGEQALLANRLLIISPCSHFCIICAFLLKCSRCRSFCAAVLVFTY